MVVLMTNHIAFGNWLLILVKNILLSNQMKWKFKMASKMAVKPSNDLNYILITVRTVVNLTQIFWVLTHIFWVLRKAPQRMIYCHFAYIFELSHVLVSIAKTGYMDILFCSWNESSWGLSTPVFNSVAIWTYWLSSSLKPQFKTSISPEFCPQRDWDLNSSKFCDIATLGEGCSRRNDESRLLTAWV